MASSKAVCLNRFLISEPFPRDQVMVSMRDTVGLNRFLISEPFPRNRRGGDRRCCLCCLNRFLISEPFPRLGLILSRWMEMIRSQSLLNQRTLSKSIESGPVITGTSTSQSLLNQRTLSKPRASAAVAQSKKSQSLLNQRTLSKNTSDHIGRVTELRLNRFLISEPFPRT